MTIDELNTIQSGDVLTHMNLNNFDIVVSSFVKSGNEIFSITTTVEDTIDDVPVKRDSIVDVVRIAGDYKLRIESKISSHEKKDYSLSSWRFKHKITPSVVKLGDLSSHKIEGLDAVNHPSYYGGADNVYEVRKIRKALKLGFNLGNTFKYIARAGKKDKSKHLEDLEKALFYLKDEIAEVKEGLNVTK